MDFFKSLTLFDIVAQGFGVLGITASILSFQCKKHKPLIYLRTANEMCFAVQYYMLGAFTGFFMNIFGSLRNMVFARMVAKNKNTIPARIIFSVLFVIFTALSWAGYKSILSGFAKVLSTFAYGSDNTAFVRTVLLITCSCWLVYNAFVGSFAGVVCEALTICSIVIGIFRYDLKKQKNSITYNKRTP